MSKPGDKTGIKPDKLKLGSPRPHSSLASTTLIPPNSLTGSPSKPASSSNPTASTASASKPASSSKPTASSGPSSRPALSINPTASTASASKPASSSNPTASTASTSKPASSSKPSASTGPSSRPVSSINHTASPVCPSRFMQGNICPRGVDPKMGSGFKSPPKKQVLSSRHSGYGYGYGSIINPKKIAQETEQSGNQQFSKGRYTEALQDYDMAVRMNPRNVSCRINRADTLVQLGRFEEALREYGEAKTLDPGNNIVHHRLSLFHLRLGVVDIAEMHMTLTDPECTRYLSAKIEKVKDHLVKGANERRGGNWNAALKEVDSIIADGTDSSQSVLAFRAEMLLRLERLDQAESTISKALELESKLPTLLKFLGMVPEAYLCAVHAQIEMALGRFKNAVASADRAHRVDLHNDEISAVQSNVRLTSLARIKGNKLYRSGDYLGACEEYEGGLRYASSNTALLSNLAVCHCYMGRWQKCVELCNQVLQIRPDYTKALLRRAYSFTKLEKWAESVRDYEALKKNFPGDAKIAEALLHAQVALKESHGENVSNKKFGAEVKEITSLAPLQEAISKPGASVVFFTEESNAECTDISGFVDSLCTSFPSVNFFKVDINQCPLIAAAENVQRVPTFKIYKNGDEVKEMICPEQKTLESLVMRIASKMKIQP